MSMNRLLEQCILSILVLLGQTAQAAHTYQAANAWVEGGVDRVVSSSSCIASSTLSPAISNFTTTVSYNRLGSYSEASNTLSIYRLSTLSEYGSYGDPDYVSRHIETIIHD
jgi:MSHA biogenesis protein MshP